MPALQFHGITQRLASSNSDSVSCRQCGLPWCTSALLESSCAIFDVAAEAKARNSWAPGYVIWHHSTSPGIEEVRSRNLRNCLDLACASFFSSSWHSTALLHCFHARPFGQRAAGDCQFASTCRQFPRDLCKKGEVGPTVRRVGKKLAPGIYGGLRPMPDQGRHNA